MAEKYLDGKESLTTLKPDIPYVTMIIIASFLNLWEGLKNCIFSASF